MKEPLDFSPATHQINELLYPVKLLPILAVSSEDEPAFETNRHKAIINENTKEIVSIVSSNYKLLSNKEAIERGKSAFKTLFPKVDIDELIPFKVIAPNSLASCHIDFIHRDVKLSDSDWEQDTWFPFLRVSNSYNRTVAFKLELGFVRELCSNGVIFQKDTLEIKQYHDKELKANFIEISERLKQYEKAFVAHLNRLKSIKIESKLVFDVVCKVLNLKFDVNNQNPNVRDREIGRKEKTMSIINEITQAYFNEMSGTAYAVMNVLSDFVSHQSDYRCIPGFFINPDVYYQKVGAWMR